MQQPPNNNSLKIIAIIIASVVVVGLVGAGAYVLTRSTPNKTNQAAIDSTVTKNSPNSSEDTALAARDAARKVKVSEISGAVTSYMANNRGSMPTATSLKEYFTVDPTIVSSPSTSLDVYVYQPGTLCSGAAGMSRQYSVATKLESGGTYCLDS